jgi:type 1 glutamine amidotransferase
MKKALIVYGGWEGHEPEGVAWFFKSILDEEGYDVELSDTLDVFLDRDKLKSLDLIIPHWTMGTITTAQLEPVMDAVASGVGMAGCHAGMCDAFHDSVDWQWMTGGQWVSHPGGQKVKYTVNVTQGANKITEGISDFEVVSEQYYMHVDPANDVLATTRFPVLTENLEIDKSTKLDSSGFGMWNFEEDSLRKGTAYLNKPVNMPVVWTKRWGIGKIFYCSVGHDVTTVSQEPVKTLFRRGMIWSSKE